MGVGTFYLGMNTVDGIPHILWGGHNDREGEEDETGDAPVEPEHCIWVSRWEGGGRECQNSDGRARKFNMKKIRQMAL